MAETGPAFNKRAHDALRRLEWRLRKRVDNPLVGDHRSLFRGRGMEFDRVVRYTFGDDVRDIDWNVTARLGEPYRKLFVEERDVTIHVVVNDTPALQFGSGDHSKRERLLELAGLILLMASLNRERASMVHRWPGGETRLPPTRHRRRVMTALTQLFDSQLPDPGANLPFDETPLALSGVPRSALVIWLGEVPRTMPGIEWAARMRRQQVIGIRIEDAWERHPPDTAFTAYDPVRGDLAVVVPGSSIKAAHAAWAAEQTARWEAWWPQPGQRLVIDALADPLVALVGFLRGRRA